jgi:hypothetical protein
VQQSFTVLITIVTFTDYWQVKAASAVHANMHVGGLVHAFVVLLAGARCMAHVWVNH